MDIKGKKVLLVGLGTLGGGLETAKWLLSRGAKLTVTDLRKKSELSASIKKLGKDAKKINWVLGKHRESDFKENEVVVLNAGVKILGNKFLKVAEKNGAKIVNDLTIFLEELKNQLVAVTGTRGKTTTANWVAHFLSAKHGSVKASGNSSNDALLKLLARLGKYKKTPAVVELSSFQLEVVGTAKKAPDVAILTNLFKDHINRHGTMKNYALAKANIFLNQKKNQKLVLNYDNKWTRFFLSKKPKAKTYFVSLKKLPSGKNGLCFDGEDFVFSEHGKKKKLFSGNAAKSVRVLGDHNIYNFLASALGAHLFGISWRDIESRIKTLPQIKYREEPVLKKKNLLVINDTTATSPEGGIAAVRRFGRECTILIAGGTDKGLDYREWAREVKKNISPKNLLFLEGSATKKMVRDLKKIGFFKSSKSQEFKDLKDILQKIREITKKGNHIVLFSPSAASFEKFRNEFDRGEKFNILVKKLFK